MVRICSLSTGEGNSRTKIAAQKESERASGLWRATEHSLSLPLSMDKHTCVSKLPRLR